MKAIGNLWYHYKTALIVAAAVLLGGLWLLWQQQGLEKADYDVAVVSPRFFPEETVTALQGALEAAGEDINHDGRTVVSVHVYRVALGQDGQDINAISALDADLAGNVSGLYLLADPGAFEEATNGICRVAEAVSVSSCPPLEAFSGEGLFLALRREAEARYEAYFTRLSSTASGRATGEK